MKLAYFFFVLNYFFPKIDFSFCVGILSNVFPFSTKAKSNLLTSSFSFSPRPFCRPFSISAIAVSSDRFSLNSFSKNFISICFYFNIITRLLYVDSIIIMEFFFCTNSVIYGRYIYC